jgi:hypothetical protein
MNPKPRPNQEAYLRNLRRMTPQQRLDVASDLSDSVRELFLAGLRQRHPEMSEQDIRRLMRQKLYPECCIETL